MNTNMKLYRCVGISGVEGGSPTMQLDATPIQWADVQPTFVHSYLGMREDPLRDFLLRNPVLIEDVIGRKVELVMSEIHRADLAVLDTKGELHLIETKCGRTGDSTVKAAHQLRHLAAGARRAIVRPNTARNVGTSFPGGKMHLHIVRPFIDLTGKRMAKAVRQIDEVNKLHPSEPPIRLHTMVLGLANDPVVGVVPKGSADAPEGLTEARVLGEDPDREKVELRDLPAWRNTDPTPPIESRLPKVLARHTTTLESTRTGRMGGWLRRELNRKEKATPILIRLVFHGPWPFLAIRFDAPLLKLWWEKGGSDPVSRAVGDWLFGRSKIVGWHFLQSQLGKHGEAYWAPVTGEPAPGPEILPGVLTVMGQTVKGLAEDFG